MLFIIFNFFFSVYILNMASSDPLSASASNTPPYSNENPPPVDLTAPPLLTYASKFPGSPDEQAYARQQANANAQTDLNQKHAGGRRRRRRRRRSLRGGDPDDPPANHIIVPQTDTGVHVAGPQNANSASLNGNQTLINGRAQSQYDSLVPAPVILGSNSNPPPAAGGRRRTRKKRHRRTKRRRKRKKTRKRRRKRRKRRRRKRRTRKRHRRRTRRRRRTRKKKHYGGYRGGCTSCILG